MLDETKPLDVILEAIQDIKKEHEALRLANLIPLSEMAKRMPKGFRSEATLRKLTVGSNPPILSYIQLDVGYPIVMNEIQVMKDLEIYEKRGLARQ